MWTEERVKHLRELVQAPGLSASAIARLLGGGLSRNAVIGKVNRLGLALPNQGNRNPIRSGISAVRTSPRAVNPFGRKRMMVGSRRAALPDATSLAPDAPIDPTAADEGAAPATSYEHMVQFLGLENHHCRFPLWRDRVPPINEQWYCGAAADVADGRPYCRYHLSITYQPPRERTPRPYNKWAEAAE